MNEYRENYVLCSVDAESKRLVYHTGKTTVYGSLYYGNVLEAKRFPTLADAAAAIASNPGEFWLGINIINIADVTFKKIAESKNGDKVLYNKFHDPYYALR